LPECRAYEQVTPPFKEAAQAWLAYPGLTPGGLFGIAADGTHVDVFSTGNFGDAQSGYLSNSYELTRTESGWTEQNVDLPASRFAVSEADMTTPELGAALYETQTRLVDGSLGPKHIWLREADGTLRDVGPTSAPEDEGEGSTFKMASEDLSHVLFSNPVDEGAMEYNTFQGGPGVPVGVEPDGKRCAANLLGAESFTNSPQTISADGSIVYFSCSGELFARVEEARTVGLSEPSAADCSACDTSPGPNGPEFDGTAVGGSEFFFTTTGTSLLGSDTSTNIYEYDFNAPQASAENPDGRIVQVSAGDWGPGGAQVEQIVASEDGSHVYFLARGALQGARSSQGESPIEGSSNLYVFERDAQFPEGRLSFIAAGNPGTIEIRPNLENSGSAVTSDGRFFVFTSTADLTPGDTSTAQQIFEYDAQTGALVRCSIGQNGFNDNGNTDVFNAELPPRTPGHGLLAVSAEGAVVFQSADGLTPGALNGYLGEYERYTVGDKKLHKEFYYANNIYEYHAGSVYLISDGQDTSYGSFGLEKIESAVKVRGISSSGDDIFFETADKLAPQDQDDQRDIYDARIDGGFPAAVSLLPTCAADACQGELSSAPTLLSPGSEFQAGGNPPLAESVPAAAKPKAKAKAKAKGCRKGYTKKRGKCVKAKARKASNDRRVKS
jgi:hypothetical protein